MKQSCYFAKYVMVSSAKIGVTLFSLQLCVHDYMLKILCEKLVSRCWGLLLEVFRAIGTSFDKPRKPMIL